MKRILTLLFLLVVGFTNANDIVVLTSDGEKQDTNLITNRKGLHIGFHVAPGLGVIKGKSTAFEEYDFLPTIELDYNERFGIAGGFDLKYFFNQFIGIKTGAGVEYIIYNVEGTIIDYDEFLSIYDYKLTNITIPLQFVLTTGERNKVGFFFTTGLIACFPVNSSYSFSIEQNNSFPVSGEGNKNDELNNVLVSFVGSLGINIPLSNSLSMNIEGFTHLGLTDYYTYDDPTNLRMYGLQIGLSFKTKK